MTQMNLQHLPSDILIYELFPKLDIQDLSNLSLINKKLRKIILSEMKKRVQRGDLPDYNIREVYDIGTKFSQFKYYAIQDILYKLNSNIIADLVTALPHQNWKLEALNLNPSITYASLPLVWYQILSSNPAITYQDVLSNPNMPWKYSL